MALNAYTIYGAPFIQRKRSNEALDVQVLVDSDESCLSQPARVANQAKTRFVPAQGEYDDNGILRSAGKALNSSSTTAEQALEVRNWYTSLPRRHTGTPVGPDTSKNAPISIKSLQTPPTSSKPPAPVPPESAIPVTQNKSRHGGDWFKSKPIDLKLGSVASSTLVEMLRRDPPNVSNPHTPPVYYGIGPTNKGYKMLSKGGWEEGQPLGPRAGIGSAESSRRRPSPKQITAVTAHHAEGKKKEKWILLDTAMPKLVVRKEGEGPNAPAEIIDLTNPDEEEETEESSEEEAEDSEMFIKPENTEASSDSSEEDSDPQPQSSTHSKAILTPIPVALKHDRKGLGLSKSKKLITHSSLALRHHIQHGALDRRHHISEMRRLERERLQGEFGRGKRAFARKAKEEQRKRDKLMEYMGS